MAVNFADLKYVVNWGPARNLLDQLQEAGWAGQDGERSHIVIVSHGQQLSQCEHCIKDFVKCEGCLHVALYKSFEQNIKSVCPCHTAVLIVPQSAATTIVARCRLLRKWQRQHATAMAWAASCHGFFSNELEWCDHQQSLTFYGQRCFGMFTCVLNRSQP